MFRPSDLCLSNTSAAVLSIRSHHLYFEQSHRQIKEMYKIRSVVALLLRIFTVRGKFTIIEFAIPF